MRNKLPLLSLLMAQPISRATACILRLLWIVALAVVGMSQVGGQGVGEQGSPPSFSRPRRSTEPQVVAPPARKPQPEPRVGIMPATNKETGGRKNATRSTSGPGGLPFQIEVGLNPRPDQVILAVDAVTAFHCPDTVLQVLFGDKQGIGLAESVEGQSRTDFYLRPTKPGVVTNIFIEMPTSTVTVMIRTVAVKGGPKLGGYHGQVYVRAPGYRDELKAKRERLDSTERDLAACNAEKREMEETIKRDTEQGLARIEAALMSETLGILSGGSGKAGKRIQTKRVRVAQIGQAARFESGRVWVMLEIENRDKHQPLNLQLSSDGFQRVLASTSDIAPRARARLAVVLIPPSDTAGAGATRAVARYQNPAALTLTIEGEQVVLPLR